MSVCQNKYQHQTYFHFWRGRPCGGSVSWFVWAIIVFCGEIQILFLWGSMSWWWDTGTDICVRATRVGHPTPPVSEGGGWEGGWQRHSDLTYSTPLHSANISRSVNFTHFHLHCLPRTSRGDLSQDWCWTSEYTLHCRIRTPDIITTTYCFVFFFILDRIGCRMQWLNLISSICNTVNN